MPRITKAQEQQMDAIIQAAQAAKDATRTPAPWHHMDGLIYSGMDGKHIAKMVESPYSVPLAQQSKNAALIAAAPDLLEALKSLIEYPDNGAAVYPGCLTWEDARAAIAKALGK